MRRYFFVRCKSLKDFSLSTKAIDELLGSYQNTRGFAVATEVLPVLLPRDEEGVATRMKGHQ